MPTKILGLTILLLFFCLPGTSQEIESDSANYTGNFFKRIQNDTEKELRLEKISRDMEKVSMEIDDGFSGSIFFGLNGQEVKRDNFFVISTGISLSNGIYPFKFELNSGILAQIQNGSFSETVSNLSISFDYNYSDKDLSKQSYVFINGTNNSYLGIDQRYEIGGGFILNFYSGNRARKVKDVRNNAFDDPKSIGLTKEGIRQMEILNGSGESFNDVERFLNDELKVLRTKSNQNDSSIDQELPKKRTRLVNTLIKKFSTTRLSLLAGMNYELEKTADSLELYNDELQRNQNFESTNRYRLVLRPGLDWKGENFSFSSRFYIKSGIFEEFYNRVGDGINEDKRLDYWTEWTTALNFNFTEKIGVAITYTLFYDNAPNRGFFNISTTGGSDFRLFSAENRFKAILLSFTYGL